MDNNVDPAFSRSPIGGKKNSFLSFRCADELKFELQRRLVASGCHSMNELAELLLAEKLFGEDHLMNVHREKVRKASALSTNATSSSDQGRGH